MLIGFLAFLSLLFLLWFLRAFNFPVLPNRRVRKPLVKPRTKSGRKRKKVQSQLQKLKHQQNIRQGERVLQSLRVQLLTAESKLPVVIGTLRRISSYVFEELLLSAALDQGWQIQRNFRYSGDGGVDGRVLIEGQLYLVQAKRYRHHVSSEHIKDFQQAIFKEGAKGALFVHTGKTGPQAKQMLQVTKMFLISG